MNNELAAMLRNGVPWIVGFMVASVYGLFLCFNSVVEGPSGVAPGMVIGPFVVGQVSRYLDPFIIGPLVGFIIVACKYSPPHRGLDANDYITSLVLGTIGLVLFFGSMTRMGINFSFPNFLVTFVVYMLILPFGFRGVIIPTMTVLFAVWIFKGLVIVAICVPIIWVGKWLVWFTIATFRFGFSTAMEKSKEQWSTPPLPL